ncbi:MAG: hypothetical protein A3K65_09535 [Euryarchaeota archaeon RBG_16_68_12]|nr:MAG: hypothetical protein A3K65_09535 [Euryarchaeota archaeon RBG_16_68_12]
MEKQPPFPLETLRHWYVTPYGGRSRELDLDQVGIRRVALEVNTELDPAVDRVRIGLLGQRNTRPLLIDRTFELVALDETRPEALAKSPIGEAVLPEGDEVVRHPFRAPASGDSILINGVMAKRLQSDPEALAKALEAVLRESRRTRPAS